MDFHWPRVCCRFSVHINVNTGIISSVHFILAVWWHRANEWMTKYTKDCLVAMYFKHFIILCCSLDWPCFCLVSFERRPDVCLSCFCLTVSERCLLTVRLRLTSAWISIRRPIDENLFVLFSLFTEHGNCRDFSLSRRQQLKNSITPLISSCLEEMGVVL